MSPDDLALMGAYEARTGAAWAADEGPALRPEQEAELADYLALEQRIADLDLGPVAPGVRGLILSAAAEQAAAPAMRQGGLMGLLAGLLRPGPVVALATLVALAVAVSIRMETPPAGGQATSDAAMVAMADEARPAEAKPDEAGAETPAGAPAAAPLAAAPRPSRTIEAQVAPMDPEAMRAARDAATNGATAENAAPGPEPTTRLPPPTNLDGRLGALSARGKGAVSAEKDAAPARPAPRPARKRLAFALPPPASEPPVVPTDDASAPRLSQKEARADGDRGVDLEVVQRGASSRTYAPAPATPKAELARQPAPQASPPAKPLSELKALQEQAIQLARTDKTAKGRAQYLKVLRRLQVAARRSGDKGMERWATVRIETQIAAKTNAQGAKTNAQGAKTNAKAKATAPPAAGAANVEDKN